MHNASSTLVASQSTSIGQRKLQIPRHHWALKRRRLLRLILDPSAETSILNNKKDLKHRCYTPTYNLIILH
jgi:hypothetical protein